MKVVEQSITANSPNSSIFSYSAKHFFNLSCQSWFGILLLVNSLYSFQKIVSSIIDSVMLQCNSYKTTFKNHIFIRSSCKKTCLPHLCQGENQTIISTLRYRNYGKSSKFSFLFANKMVVIRAGNNKMLVRIANREDPDQSDLGLCCLSRQLVFKILKYLP